MAGHAIRVSGTQARASVPAIERHRNHDEQESSVRKLGRAGLVSSVAVAADGPGRRPRRSRGRPSAPGSRRRCRRRSTRKVICGILQHGAAGHQGCSRRRTPSTSERAGAFQTAVGTAHQLAAREHHGGAGEAQEGLPERRRRQEDREAHVRRPERGARRRSRMPLTKFQAADANGVAFQADVTRLRDRRSTCSTSRPVTRSARSRIRT